MADHYQLEDGSGNYQLEDGTGAYLLEDIPTVFAGGVFVEDSPIFGERVIQ